MKPIFALFTGKTSEIQNQELWLKKSIKYPI